MWFVPVGNSGESISFVCSNACLAVVEFRLWVFVVWSKSFVAIINYGIEEFLEDLQR